MNNSTTRSKSQQLCAALGAAALLLNGATALADGTETLGTPGISIATGSGVVAAGVGLAAGQPGVININVPAGTIKQVLLYWEGVGTPYQALFGDDTVVLNGSIVATGDFIGGNEDSFGNAPLDGAFRADITSLNLITTGPNALSVGGLDFDSANGGYVNGAGLLVIFDNGTASQIDLRDGKDFAYVFRAAPYNATVKQGYTFPASSTARVAQLSMLFASETFAGQGQRPSSIEVIVGNVTNTISNPLNNVNGAEWDTLVFDIDIPAGVTNLSVQGFSRDDSMTPGSNPASIVWTAAALSVPLPKDKCEPKLKCCRSHRHDKECYDDDDKDKCRKNHKHGKDCDDGDDKDKCRKNHKHGKDCDDDDDDKDHHSRCRKDHKHGKDCDDRDHIPVCRKNHKHSKDCDDRDRTCEETRKSDEDWKRCFSFSYRNIWWWRR